MLTAMSGFTTQNCRVACQGKKVKSWGRTKKLCGEPLLWPGEPVLDAGVGGVLMSCPEGTAVWRGGRSCEGAAVQCGRASRREEEGEGWLLGGRLSAGRGSPLGSFSQKGSGGTCQRHARDKQREALLPRPRGQGQTRARG